LQTILTIFKIVSLIGLLIFGFILAAKSEIWQSNWANAFHLQSFDKTENNWVQISGTGIIAALSAGMVGSVFQVMLGMV